ncbi:TonB-dependent receptor domain-containing protein [Galbibacter mesophilus]|uniref:TonB-dependent receptor domain-containing protein n=1 Tax=Galbibacter mesophilus TaxID=379069 RepID=UPI00191D8983|nr:TonB-dependent receptor [Galbibacter mesophilus]MCM5661530.1 TonB-dependent receptor [Galbibacter mesophilus]
MRSKFTWLLSLLMVIAFQFSYAQEKTITGTVTDQDGLPLPGASVRIKGTSTGTQTDFDGNYTINASTGEVLVFSFVGQKTEEKTVGAASVINIALEQDAQALEEVIVTGQGSGIQKKRLSTTVDVIDAEQIDRLPATQIDQILQSNAPSAQIRLSSGQPGTAAIIRTRGPISAASSSTPVVIVDGIRVDNLNSNPELGLDTGGASVSALADIPVESIEKIEYIKGGAATTLYGADAANGVIQIITKKGKEGKATVFYEGRVGVIKGTKDYLEYDRTAEALFDPGVSIEHRFGINGGSEKFTYNFGGSLYEDDSFNDVNEQVRRSFTFGFGAEVSDKLRYQGSFSYTGFENTLDFNANTSFSRFSNFEGGVFGDLNELSDAEWQAEIERSDAIAPLVDINRKINRFTASNKFTYDITGNLQANATLGVDYRESKDEEVDSNALQIALGSIPEGTTDQAFLSRVLRSSFTTTADLNFTHSYDMENFSFVSILGGQFFRSSDFQNRLDGSGGVDGTSSINNFSIRTASDFLLENANYGLYFLENIGIYNVAYLELGGRLDKNTSAGENTSAIFLPKIGVTYNISDHEFYRESGLYNAVSTLKLRANYGEATNFAQPFSQDKTFALESFLEQPAFRFDQPGNPDLVSELVKTYEFGVDLGFLYNRLNFGVTYYNATTEDALFTPGAPPSSGQLNQIQNIGEIENKGWEFELNAKILQGQNHNLSMGVSYNTNENLVTSTGGSAPFNVGGFTVIGSWVEEGESLGYLRGTIAELQDDGTYAFTPNASLGKTFAPYFGSLNLNYSYKNFSLFVTGDYQYGGSIVDLSFLLRVLRGVDSEGIPDELFGQTSPFNYTNFVTFDNDFFKIRNIGASYRFGDALKPFNDVILSFNVTNPFNWTAGDFDPEITGSGIGTQNGFSSGGFAYGTESAPRIFLTSLKFQF